MTRLQCFALGMVLAAIGVASLFQIVEMDRIVRLASIGALVNISAKLPSRQPRRMQRVKRQGLSRNNVPRLPKVEFLERSFMSGLPCMYELVMNSVSLALDLRREVNTHPVISKYFHILTPGEMVPKEFRASGVEDYGKPHATWDQVLAAWDDDEFALDPTRLTIVTGRAGYDGTQFNGQRAAAVLTSASARHKLVDALRAELERRGWDGRPFAKRQAVI